MPSNWAWCSVVTKKCIMWKSCLPLCYSMYCKFSKNANFTESLTFLTFLLFFYHNSTAFKHLPFPVHYSYRFYLDFCSHFGQPCSWYVHVQLLVRHCAICCRIWLVVAWSNIIVQIVRHNGPYKSAITRTNC